MRDDGNVVLKLQGMLQRHPIAGLSDPRAPGAEDLRAAVDIAIARERTKHFVEPWKEGRDECAVSVWRHAQQLMENNRPALKTYAKREGFHNQHDRPPGAQRSEFADKPVGTWHESRYAHVPHIPEGQTIVGKLESGSRFQDVPDPPKRKDGSPDFDAISEMHGHRDYLGPGSASRGRRTT